MAGSGHFEGKHVAITGAARGIGLATAKDVAALGARLSIGDLDGELAAEAAAGLPTASGFHVDVSDRARFKAFLDAAEAAHGPIDILVNNAGIMLVGPFLEQSEERSQAMLDINVMGTVNGMQLVLPRMLERGCGHVVNLASSAGLISAAGLGVYCGTKSAVIAITDAARAELRKSPVNISMVLPGPVNTQLAAGIGEAKGIKNVEAADVSKAVMKAITKNKGRVHVPAPIATLGVFNALPKGLRDKLLHGMGAHTSMLEADRSQRDAYEETSVEKVS